MKKKRCELSYETTYVKQHMLKHDYDKIIKSKEVKKCRQ